MCYPWSYRSGVVHRCKWSVRFHRKPPTVVPATPSDGANGGKEEVTTLEPKVVALRTDVPLMLYSLPVATSRPTRMTWLRRRSREGDGVGRSAGKKIQSTTRVQLPAPAEVELRSIDLRREVGSINVVSVPLTVRLGTISGVGTTEVDVSGTASADGGENVDGSIDGSRGVESNS